MVLAPREGLSGRGMGAGVFRGARATTVRPGGGEKAGSFTVRRRHFSGMMQGIPERTCFSFPLGSNGSFPTSPCRRLSPMVSPTGIATTRHSRRTLLPVYHTIRVIPERPRLPVLTFPWVLSGCGRVIGSLSSLSLDSWRFLTCSEQRRHSELPEHSPECSRESASLDRHLLAANGAEACVLSARGSVSMHDYLPIAEPDAIETCQRGDPSACPGGHA